jgi:hypothetical protein
MSAFLGADVAKHLETRAARQHEVEDHTVVIDHLGLHAGLIAVVEDVDGIALLLQALLDEARHLPVIFDDKHSHRRIAF